MTEDEFAAEFEKQERWAGEESDEEEEYFSEEDESEGMAEPQDAPIPHICNFLYDGGYWQTVMVCQ